MPVAVDIGDGWTKALSTERSFLEPSVVGPSVPLLEGLGGTQGVRVWDANGNEYRTSDMPCSESGA